MSEDDSLSEKQENAIELMLKGLNDSEVAERVGVSRQWVNHWRNQDEAFREALAARRQTLREQNIDRLNELVEEAIAAAREALRSQNENTRLKAAALILKVSGMQEGMRGEKPADGGRAEFLRELGSAIGEVAREIGFRDPTEPDEPKQLGDGSKNL